MKVFLADSDQLNFYEGGGGWGGKFFFEPFNEGLHHPLVFQTYKADEALQGFTVSY